MTLADKIRAMAIADPHGAHDVWNAALDRAADLAEQHQADADAQDWQSDPAANPAWNAGCDFAMTAICKMLKVDPHSISWDAATEELEGDVMSVIGNIMMAAFGDDWQDAILADAALDRIKAEAVKEAMADFSKADWFWRDLDPDDCGDTPDEAINAGMVGRFTVCLIRSAFTGPDRFCFISPVLDPESDDEECLCFRTEDEAIAAVEERLATLKATGEAGNG